MSSPSHAQNLPVELVTLIGGVPKTNSLIVAERFHKRHADVMRALNKLECSAEFNQRNFAFVDYIDAKGEKRPMVEMTKDGFMFLVMGFTGAEAARTKEAYIGEFNRMEAELRGQSAAQPSQPLPAPLPALPAPDKLSRELRSAINRAAHEVAMRQYDTIHAILTEAMESNLACGATEEKCLNIHLPRYAELVDGTVLANIRDMKELVHVVGGVIDAAGSAIAAIRRIEERSGYRLYDRLGHRKDAAPAFHKHDRLVEEVIDRIAGI